MGLFKIFKSKQHGAGFAPIRGIVGGDALSLETSAVLKSTSFDVAQTLMDRFIEQRHGTQKKLWTIAIQGWLVAPDVAENTVWARVIEVTADSVPVYFYFDLSQAAKDEIRQTKKAHGKDATSPVVDLAKWEKVARARVKAEEGDADFQVYLASCLAAGWGVPQDEPGAVKWIIKAAEQGHAEAQAKLGEMHEAGVGVAQDWSEAVRWYRLAACQGHPLGQKKLAHCYEQGRGVEADHTQALRWYRQASAQGDSEARNVLATFGLLPNGSI